MNELIGMVLNDPLNKLSIRRSCQLSLQGYVCITVHKIMYYNCKKGSSVYNYIAAYLSTNETFLVILLLQSSTEIFTEQLIYSNLLFCVVIIWITEVPLQSLKSLVNSLIKKLLIDS